MEIIDIKLMPNYNYSITNGIDSVSNGNVFINEGENHPVCIKHGALLKVSSHGIWRCGELGCSNGCFQVENNKIEAWNLRKMPEEN